MGPLAYPSEPGGGTRSLTGDCEVTSHEIGHTCRTPEAARDALVRLVASGQGESDAALALRWKIALALEPFVAQRARRASRRDPEGAADLTQTALADLVVAAHTWDPSLGALSTWAQWRLRPILDRAAAAQLGEATPRIGPAYYQAARQVDGLRSLGDSLESACATASISPAVYQAVRDAARPAVRLDAPVPGGEKGDTREIDRLTDGGDPEAAILAGIERAAVRAALETLEPRTQEILHAHLGGQTYAQIAAALGLSRERVRQIVLAAIRQLQEHLGITPGPRERQQAGAREGAQRRRARTLERVESFQTNPETPRERCWLIDAGVACTRRVDRRGLCESHAQIAARHGRLEALSRPREGGGQPGWPRGAALWRTESGARGGRTSAAQRRAKADARIATWIPDPVAPRSRCWLIDAGVACEAPVARRGLCARHSRALDRAGPDALDRLSRPRKSPESAGPVRPPPAALPSSSGEGQAAERSAVPVEAQAEPPAVAVAESEGAGRGLPAPEPPATAEGQPTSTPDPWDGPEGRTHSEPQEAPVARAATLPPVDPVAPPGRCRLLGCATSSNVRGLCLPHYDLARRKGQLDELALPPIPRGRGTRFQRPAESAPSTRPQRAPRTRRAGAAAAAAPRHEGEALRAIWVALGSPELAQSESMDLEILRAAEQRLRLDAQLASRITELEEDGLRLRAQLDGQIQLTTDRVLERERARADADALRARVEELEGLLARKMKIQQETMRADVAEKRFESLRCALEQIAGYAPSPHLPDEVLIRESSEGVAWLRQELEAARGQIAALENSGREGDAAAEELARALGTPALPLLEVARRASAQILEAASRIADLRTALAEVADNDPDERTDAELIAAAPERIRYLSDGWETARREGRLYQTAADLAEAKLAALQTLEPPESLERRYQALQSARRLRALLEGREEPRIQLPEGVFSLQEIWLWDLLAPLIPGEIERLEREAGVSRG